MAGQLVDDGGSMELWGRYQEAQSSGICTVNWTENVFAGEIRQAASFFDEGYVYAEGGYDVGSAGSLTGSGQSDWKPFVEQGTATFTPDSGQSCGNLSSGTMTQRVTFSDGGDGNPAAQNAVHRYQTEEDNPSPPATTARQADHSRKHGRSHKHHGHKSHGRRR
jgi:hypothetical protein